MEFSTIIAIVDRGDEERSDLGIVEATTGLLIGYHMHHLQPLKKVRERMEEKRRYHTNTRYISSRPQNKSCHRQPPLQNLEGDRNFFVLNFMEQVPW